MSGRTEALANAATVVVAGCAVIVTVLVVRGQVHSSAPPGLEPRAVADWRQYADVGRRFGPEGAALTIVEFGDYECPVCRVAEKHVRALRGRFPDEVAVVYRHWPLSQHRYAYAAARAAECAGEQGAFQSMHEAIFDHEEWLGDAFLRFAADAEVPDLDTFSQCIANTEPVPSIERDMAAALAVGATGTPTFIVNGFLYAGALDSLRLFQMLEEVREK